MCKKIYETARIFEECIAILVLLTYRDRTLYLIILGTDFNSKILDIYGNYVKTNTI